MLNPQQTKLHIDNEENTVTINSGDNLDFSIHTLDLIQGDPANLNLSNT